MNWTDFFFGAVAGSLFVLVVVASFAYRVMRPFIKAASVAAKANTKGPRPSAGVGWPPAD